MKYLSLEKKSFTEFIERKSVFYGSACPVTTEEEALKFIGSVKKQFADATHNVYAYVLRENNLCRFSDDGEPHGTAGIPVLDVIRKEGLTDTAIVVTRYFGGILLGAGGLVRAYTASAKQAVDAAGIAEWVDFVCFKVKSDYTDFQKLSYYYKKNSVTVENTEYSDTVTSECFVEAPLFDSVYENIISLTNGRANIIKTGIEYKPK